MNLTQLEEMMVAQNPHWRGESYSNILNHKRTAFDVLWQKLRSDRLILAISGPRRIGKSYLFKQLIAELIGTKTAPPQNILYFPFSSTMDEASIIKDLLTIFRDRYADQKQGKLFVFLDEIQFVSSWPDQVKFFYDQEQPIKFALTGSTTLFGGKKVRESLLGRIIKFPMGVLSFPEYLEFRGIKTNISGRADFINSLPNFRVEFPKYLAFGEYPELALHPEINAKDYLLSTADQLINFDIPYLHEKVERTLFSNLVKTLSFELANEFSINRMAAGLGVPRGIITEYVRILEETGYFATCLNSFYRKMRSKLSASKKIYSLNTNLSLAINGFDQTYFNDSRVLGHYAENYVFMRLREKFGQSIEYYSDGKREIDFVTDKHVYEVKFGKTDNLEKYQEIAKKLNKELAAVTDSEFKDSIYLL